MSARPRVSDAQRRALLGVRHRLAGPGARTVAEAAGAVVGLHATDPATVFLSAAARLAEPTVAEVERSLYEEHTVTRLLCMRRTMFVVPTPLVPVVDVSTARAVAARERRGFVAEVHKAGWSDARLAAAERLLLAALAERGEATAVRLTADVPELREQLVLAPGKSYESRISVGSRLLRVLAAEGAVRRARPSGAWTSARFRWTLAEPHATDLAPAEARSRLAREYLAAFGPVTVEDVKWWTGWTLTDTRRALAAVETVEVDLDDGSVGLLLPEDHARAPSPEPWVALLPSLDPSSMGWRRRGFYLDPELVPALFDRNGNIGPTVWADGRVIGGWAQRADGRVAHRLLVDPGAEARARVAATVGELTAWLGPARVTPTFRTPLERELAAD
ncbi:AlkZ family DNA glycosylase [Streptomyces sp. OF8]|uniref:AlkZ family DNA glycosylase n=1 Tax=Streptomyces alkaliterrae TaxID=2213162 RepID=A0A5P0YKA8_9ACTN|nr:AlkZ family DNA glycosylase [Streptomyces alkaliterrae]MQS00350.1 winged helix DNA-binding domain-containing protein [Streptomyces alkaliterrae]